MTPPPPRHGRAAGAQPVQALLARPLLSKDVVGHGGRELDRHVGQVVTSSRQGGCLFMQEGGSDEVAVHGRDVGPSGEHGLLDPPVGAGQVGVGVECQAAQLLGAIHISVTRREHRAHTQGKRVAGMLRGTGQLQCRIPRQDQWERAPHLTGCESGEDLQLGVGIAVVRRPRPCLEQVVLGRAEANGPQGVTAGIGLPDALKEVRVVGSVTGLPALALPCSVESLLAVLTTVSSNR